MKWRNAMRCLSAAVLVGLLGCGGDDDARQERDGESARHDDIARTQMAGDKQSGEPVHDLVVGAGENRWPEREYILPVEVTLPVGLTHYRFGAVSIDVTGYVDRYLADGYLPRFDEDVQEVWRVLREKGGDAAGRTREHLQAYYADLEKPDAEARQEQIAAEVGQIRDVAEALTRLEMAEIDGEALYAFLLGEPRSDASAEDAVSRSSRRQASGAAERRAARRAIAERVVDEYFPRQFEAGWSPMGAALRAEQKYRYLHEAESRAAGRVSWHAHNPDENYGEQLSKPGKYHSDHVIRENTGAALRRAVLEPRLQEALDNAYGLKPPDTYRQGYLERQITSEHGGGS